MHKLSSCSPLWGGDAEVDHRSERNRAQGGQVRAIHALLYRSSGMRYQASPPFKAADDTARRVRTSGATGNLRPYATARGATGRRHTNARPAYQSWGKCRRLHDRAGRSCPPRNRRAGAPMGFERAEPRELHTERGRPCHLMGWPGYCPTDAIPWRAGMSDEKWRGRRGVRRRHLGAPAGCNPRGHSGRCGPHRQPFQSRDRRSSARSACEPRP